MIRSALHPIPVYFDRYINKTDDVEILEAIRISLKELDNIPLQEWKALGDRIYAPGKWMIADILQHLIDTERVFTYRALAFARADAQAMPFFPEDDYAKEAKAKARNIEDLVEELKILHQSLALFYRSLTPKMLDRRGIGFKGEYSVAAIGFMLPGHQRWHFDIIEERYMPLLDNAGSSKFHSKIN